jgi:methylated-DNA-[protein]-cysteine S-methyltransferase
MGVQLFDTAIGTCGIAWSEAGLRAVQLPEATADRAMHRLRNRAGEAHGGSRPVFVDVAIRRLIKLLDHGRAELHDLPIDDHDAPALDKRIWARTRQIPAGTTLSYGELAAQLDPPPIPRAVGQAMGRNPWPLIVPCHRVLAADGTMGGFSAAGGPTLKRRLLEIEGVVLPHTPDLFGAG